MRRFVTKCGESWNWGRAGDVGVRCEGQKGWERLEATVQLCMGQKQGTEQSVTLLRKAGSLQYWQCWRWEYFSSHLVIVNMCTPEAFRAHSEQRSYSSFHSFTS